MHDHLEAENSILLKPEYETSKHLVNTLGLEKKEISKIYNILKNSNVHYDEVYQQLTKSRDNLTEHTRSKKLWQTCNYRMRLNNRSAWKRHI